MESHKFLSNFGLINNCTISFISLFKVIKQPVRSIPIKCDSLIQASRKRGKGNQKDHFWKIDIWRGYLGRSPTKNKHRAYKKLELARHHETYESNGSLHPNKST
jgi:hypothetical protein